MRQKILMCAEEYAKMQENLASKMSGLSTSSANATPSAPINDEAPSAPPVEGEAKGAPTDNGTNITAAPSAPLVETFQSNECVICMENKVKFGKSCMNFYGYLIWITNFYMNYMVSI